MLEGTSNDHRKHQFALIVGKCCVHESTNLRAANLLADCLIQHSCHVQVERLVGQIHQTRCCQGSAVNHGFQVIGLSKTILHVEVSGELEEVSKVLGRAKTVADEFSHRRQFMQQIQVHQFAIGEIDGHVAVEATCNVLSRR